MSAPESRPGILAIWNDCAEGREAAFEAWFQGEHLEERLAVPGFRFGRRHEAVISGPRFFHFYVTDTPAVLTSAAYLARVNNPTPLTRSVMSTVFRNMIRTICERTMRQGEIRGAYAAVARLDAPPAPGIVQRWFEGFRGDHGIACTEIWTAVDAGVPASTEEKLRGGDRRIRQCVIAETLRLADAERVHAAMNQVFGGKAETGIYRLLCERSPALP
ncbi:MAG: hypothetical protein AB7K35_01100 [Pseudorhodoplanes sp.]